MGMFAVMLSITFDGSMITPTLIDSNNLKSAQKETKTAHPTPARMVNIHKSFETNVTINIDFEGYFLLIICCHRAVVFLL